MTRASITANMTAAELAAWKANNRKQSSPPVLITATRKPARKTQRQEWLELRDETCDMITAANRQGHWQLIPALLQRLTTFDNLLQARCFT